MPRECPQLLQCVYPSLIRPIMFLSITLQCLFQHIEDTDFEESLCSSGFVRLFWATFLKVCSPSQPNVNGFTFNMGHLKALNYPDYPDKLSADNPVSGYLKIGTIRHSLVGNPCTRFRCQVLLRRPGVGHPQRMSVKYLTPCGRLRPNSSLKCL